ncbi:succinate dehydrogenase, hydrophobic membrane anchor protein [Methylocapsa acidiphila]|uniref:succinate dehydrogenase, hydrophobic membrane anchor protein n=1 Tax=Methylocapsa acidiphila TaxID=133552 RepID=UPI00047C0DC3|nr:succinate dehydrogenase, hydrophobic membrane anchor protein [Methylocapsa acidiphila]
MAHDRATTRTAASKVRFLGAAKTGTQDAWRVRVTSVALAFLTIAFVWIVLSLVGKDYASARAFLARPPVAILLLMFILSGVQHMKIGMQAIIDDYVHAPHLKDASLLANLFFSFAIGLACVYAVLKLSFA